MFKVVLRIDLEGHQEGCIRRDEEEGELQYAVNGCRPELGIQIWKQTATRKYSIE